jgi:multicomponent Na+:H+ antiporter subunit D
VSALVPLAVAVPLILAATIAAFGHHVPGKGANLIATAAAAAVAVICVLLVFRSSTHELVYWFGGWRPRHGVAIGISFSVDPLGAAIAAFSATLAVCAFVFSYSYFREVGHLFYSLMLVFLAGLVGFALTGDLFDLFVFFELMSVAAYALTGYKIEQPGAVQGALNFAITNTVGAFFVLFGIALLYGRTGALNLAQVGESLAGRHADGLVVGALVLLTVGFLVKAGSVPFHFWLSDAYAVAPAPVGVLLAGVMSDLGYHAIGRLYWDVFSTPTAGGAAAVRGLLLALGVTSALVGGAMCLLEADLKRVVAFLTISHGGIVLAAIALLQGAALGGATLYLVADGLLKGALFLAVGAAQNRLGASDELWLRGRGRAREHLWLGALFVVCGLGLAGLPPFGPFLAVSVIGESARSAGFGWLPPVLALATALGAAAVLRAAGRVFLGLGPSVEPLLKSQPDEPDEGEPGEKATSAGRLLTPPTALAVAGLGLAFAPTIAGRAEQLGRRILHPAARAAEVLQGRRPPPLPEPSQWHAYAAGDWVWGGASTAAALFLGLLLLERRRLPAAVRHLSLVLVKRPATLLHHVHTGVVGDYAAWIASGAALFAVVWGATLR